MSDHCAVLEEVPAKVHTAEIGRERFAEAFRTVFGAAVRRKLDIDGDRTKSEVERMINRRARAAAELIDMVRDVSLAVKAAGDVPHVRCPWTFHLLRMLEEAGQKDLARTDGQGRRLEEGRPLEVVKADLRRDIDSLRKRAERIKAALAKHDPYTHRPVDELESELATTDAWLVCLQQVAKISPDRNHLKAAALRMVMHLNSLESESALAAFIGETDEWRPRPCPTFSADDCYDNIRKILSRAS